MTIRTVLVAFGLCLMMALPGTTARAETLTIEMVNDYGRDIQVVFYSEDRNHAWPGGSQAYNLRKVGDERWKLSCRRGEKICYGAWVKGNSRTYWGVGLNRKYRCDKCCMTCDGGVYKRTLN